MKPKVRLITTGGTISGGYDISTGNPKYLDAKGLISLIPEVEKIAEIEYEDFCHVSSQLMTPEIIFKLAKRIIDIFKNDPELSGIVVTHGTDTLEESAFLLWLLIDDPRPVVITAAERQPMYIDSDGPRNLIDSIRIVISEKAKDKGVMVCLNHEINSARYVRKTHTYALETYNSGRYGIIGYIDGENIFFVYKPLNRLTIITDKIDSNVDLFKVSQGIGSRYIETSIKEGVPAIVIEGTGRGDFPQAVAESLLEARKRGIVVVIVSRCYEGRVNFEPGYGLEGIVYGEDLDGLKARLLLCLLITQTKNPELIQKYFNNLSGKT